MLSKQEDFDRDVKRVLQEVHGEEIPLDFLVDIEQRLDQLEKKKKRKVFLWFFLTIILAAITSMQFVKKSPLSSKESVHISHHQNSGIILKTFSKKTSPQHTSNNTEIHLTSHKKNITASKKSTPLISQKQANDVPEVRRKNNSAESHLTSHEKNITVTRTSSPAISKKQANYKEKVGLQPLEIHAHKENSSLDQVEFTIPQIFTHVTEDSIPFSMISEIIPLKSDVSIKAVNFNNHPVLVEPGILPIEKEKWEQTFGFFSGVSGIRSSVEIYKPTANSAFPGNIEKYAAIRNAQERSTSSIDLSLRTSWTKHHFLIQTGVDYFEWGEQLQYDYNIVYDGVNRYSYVSVPLYLGYRQSWKKISLSASLGSSIGWVIKKDGYYLQQNLTTIAVEQASDWTSTGYFQLELSYMLDNYRFSIAPTYRKSLSTVIFSGETINRYDSFGLQLGIAVILK